MQKKRPRHLHSVRSQEERQRKKKRAIFTLACSTCPTLLLPWVSTIPGSAPKTTATTDSARKSASAWLNTKEATQDERQKIASIVEARCHLA